MPFKERKYNFLVFLSRYFGYDYAYINDTSETLMSIKLQLENIIDCIKIEL